MAAQLSVKNKYWLVFANYYDLGFTAFGGPPVHFQILHNRFVKTLAWIDDKKV
jgi:chromate transport protein ChrA